MAMPSTNNSVNITDSVSESLDWNLLNDGKLVLRREQKEYKTKANQALP